MNERGSGGGASTGFSSSSVESSVREDAVAILDDVEAKVTTLDKAYAKLRKLYSTKEVSDAALQGLLGMTPSGPSQFGDNSFSLKGTQSGLTLDQGLSDDIYNLLFK